MAQKMWVWKNYNPETGEKGVIMMLRIYSYAKWIKNTLTCDVNNIKKYYNFIIGEHLEVSNPRYTTIMKNTYEEKIQDMDLWFYSSEFAKNWVISKSNGKAEKVPSMKMSAVSYLVNQDWWRNVDVKKHNKFVMVCNDFMEFKRPDWRIKLWKHYKAYHPSSKFVIVYKNRNHELLTKLKRESRNIGGVEWINNPDPPLIRDIYNRSECLIHASSTESGPRVIAEAMSCNIPCVIAREPWNASVEHLFPCILTLPEMGWKTTSGVLEIDRFLINQKNNKISPRSLVNTKGFLNKIDLKLKEINKIWTLGELSPPNWIGGNSINDINDKKFTQLTGQKLT
jgi:hypothetical protein